MTWSSTFPVVSGRYVSSPMASSTVSTSTPRAGQHAAVIDDEQVTGTQQIGEIPDVAVLDDCTGAAIDEEPRGLAVRERRLGDRRVRQLVVEGVGVHRVICSCSRDPAGTEVGDAEPYERSRSRPDPRPVTGEGTHVALRAAGLDPG